MDDARGVDVGDDRAQLGDEPPDADALPRRADQVLHRTPGNVLERDVGGAVLLELAEDLHDPRVRDPGDPQGLLGHAGAHALELGLVLLRCLDGLVVGAAALAVLELRHELLEDEDRPVVGQIVRQVGEREPSGSEVGSDLVPVGEDRPRAQRLHGTSDLPSAAGACARARPLRPAQLRAVIVLRTSPPPNSGTARYRVVRSPGTPVGCCGQPQLARLAMR